MSVAKSKSPIVWGNLSVQASEVVEKIVAFIGDRSNFDQFSFWSIEEWHREDMGVPEDPPVGAVLVIGFDSFTSDCVRFKFDAFKGPQEAIGSEFRIIERSPCTYVVVEA